MSDYDQLEIPQVPDIGRLAKLRAGINPAGAILIAARKADIMKDGKIGLWEVRPMAAKRRAIDKRIDALGMPRVELRGEADFPEGTYAAAQANSEFWRALESAVTVLKCVNAAEVAAIPQGGDRRTRRDCGGHTARGE